MKKGLLLLYLLILSVFDLRERKIPVALLFCGTLGAVCGSGWTLVSVIREQGQWQWPFLSMLLGMVPGVFVIAMARLTEKVGAGDGWILCNLGLLTDYRICVGLWGMSIIIMAIFSGGMLALKKVKGNTRIPYLPFLTLAYVVGLVS